MDFGDKEFRRAIVSKTVHVVSLTQTTKKKVKQAIVEVLALARKEIKRKEKLIKMHKVEVAKKTMQLYFESSCCACEEEPFVLGV